MYSNNNNNKIVLMNIKYMKHGIYQQIYPTPSWPYVVEVKLTESTFAQEKGQLCPYIFTICP